MKRQFTVTVRKGRSERCLTFEVDARSAGEALQIVRELHDADICAHVGMGPELNWEVEESFL